VKRALLVVGALAVGVACANAGKNEPQRAPSPTTSDAGPEDGVDAQATSAWGNEVARVAKLGFVEAGTFALSPGAEARAPLGAPFSAVTCVRIGLRGREDAEVRVLVGGAERARLTLGPGDVIGAGPLCGVVGEAVEVVFVRGTLPIEAKLFAPRPR
jgi:hypothetical protein